MILDPTPSDGTEPFPDENTAFTALYDSAAFADFEQSMDEMLETLVGRWVHLAAPNAGLRGIRRGTIASPKKGKTA